MYDQIIALLSSIILAIVGLIVGLIIEKRRHNNEIGFFILREKMAAYHTFFKDMRLTSIFTGSLVSSNDYWGNSEKCKKAHDELSSKVSQLWTDSSDPYLLNDKDIKRCMEEANCQIAIISVGIIGCANCDVESRDRCSKAHSDLMDNIRTAEKAIADKIDRHSF